MDVRIAPGETKPFAECTIEEIERAIARLREGESDEPALPRGAGAKLARPDQSPLEERPDDRAELRSEVAREGGRARVFVVLRAPLDSLHVAARAILRVSSFPKS